MRIGIFFIIIFLYHFSCKKEKVKYIEGTFLCNNPIYKNLDFYKEKQRVTVHYKNKSTDEKPQNFVDGFYLINDDKLYIVSTLDPDLVYLINNSNILYGQNNNPGMCLRIDNKESKK